MPRVPSHLNGDKCRDGTIDAGGNPVNKNASKINVRVKAHALRKQCGNSGRCVVELVRASSITQGIYFDGGTDSFMTTCPISGEVGFHCVGPGDPC